MTPYPSNTIAASPDTGTQLTDTHLTDIQIGELLDLRAAGRIAPLSLEAVEAHLHACDACAAELAGLEQTLCLYREASIAHADREFARLRTFDRTVYPVLPVNRPYSQTLWLMAASAVLIAGILPLGMRWQRGVSTPSTTASVADSAHSAESDEALLQDIDRELSASVPTSMQALSDPSGSANQILTDTGNQTSTQRKD